MTNYVEMSLARGLSFLAESQAAISNNIANATTDSYKRRLPVAQSFEGEFSSLLDANLPSISYSEATDFGPGSERQGDERDLVLGQGQFFRVEDNGSTFLTRNGRLIVDSDGRLVTPNGAHFLNSDDQPIFVGGAEGLRFANDGTITGTTVDGEVGLGRIGIFSPADPNKLQSIGSGLFFDPSETPAPATAAPELKQGYVEQSNVDVLRELVQMISVQRSFGAATKAMSTFDTIHESFVQTMNR